jgi:ABC-type glycerol-3-phosphate transport system substrate-binding protein
VAFTVQDKPGENLRGQLRVYNQLVADYEKENPNVDVQGRDRAYDPQALSSKLAGGTAETAYLIAFTDPQRIIQNNQAADITDIVKGWQYFGDLKPEVVETFSDKEGRIYGFADYLYSLGLTYNRKFFEEVGLDPDSPPTTWDQLREYAKRLTDKSKNRAGFAELSTQNQGGWHFTTWQYSAGGQPETQRGGEWVATVDDESGRAVLNMLKQMRYEDDSMTARQLLDIQKMSELLATGRVAMAVGATGDPIAIQDQYGGKAADYGIGALPQNGGNATLAGGSGFMFNPRASEEEIKAAFDWMTFEFFDPDSYEVQLKAKVDSGQTVVPISDPGSVFKEGTGIRKRLDEIARKYSTLPAENFEPYVRDNAKLEQKVEPPIESQQVYAALDTPMQAILTNTNADPAQLLETAARQIQSQVLDPVNNG